MITRVEELYRGGFGRVEKLSMSDGSVLARKVFDPTADILSITDPEKLKKRFKREVRVQSSLSPDFFVPILSSDLESDEPSFTMPLCTRNFSVQITEDKANGVVSQQGLSEILNALEELHSLGYTHRDLKPHNILFHEDRWKLSDFGLVLPPSDETTQLTSKYSAWGTELYCAPEQAQDFRSSTFSADIYSFGCILHDIFTDGVRIPYQRHTADGAIGLIIEKCTELNPKKRFKSITALRGELLAVLAEPITKAPSPEAKEWVTSLADPDLNGWETKRIRDLWKYLEGAETSDQRLVCEALDEERLRLMYEVDPDMWQGIALFYCEWAFRSGFNFAYCDVVVSRLETIFEVGSLDCKAAAAISAAELGVSHNRWYVMRRLFAMCNHSLDPLVAKRIAIEIVVEEAQSRFIDSADRLGRTVSDFHPIIAQVLGE